MVVFVMPVVIAEVSIRIGAGIESPPARRERFLEGTQVQPFGIREHAIEVEDDRRHRHTRYE